MSCQKYLTNQELLDIIDNWSDDEHDYGVPLTIETVVCLPPDNVLGESDDELIDDDEISTNVACDLSPLNEIAGEIEVVYESNVEDYAGPEEVVEPQPQTSEHESPAKKYRPKSDFKPIWKRTKQIKYDIHPVHEPLKQAKQCPMLEAIGGKNPLELFQLFFDDNVIETLVEETNRYAAQRNIAKLCDKYLIQRFIGILLFSGYHHVPHVKLFWSLDPAFGIPIVRQTMPRNIFMRLKSNFHIANNDTLELADKFAKLRPLFKMLNERYMQFGIWAEHLSIDETMVPYIGRHSAKMFIRGKPIRFGYKLWALASDSGYLFQFLPYSGASDKYDKQLGLGASVVMELLSHCEHPLQHTVHFDNFFTSHYLLCLLKERGFCASGTVFSNRIGGATLKTGMKIKGEVALKKYESDYLYDKTNNILVVRWMDNSEVTIATNYDTVEPMVNVQRYSREKKKKISVPQPHVFNSYNRHMGGVDSHDNGVANYRIGIRGKKWWWPLWVQCLDSAVVNAWKLHSFLAASTKATPMPQLDFKNFIVKNLLLASKDSLFDTESTTTDDSHLEDVCRPSNLPRVTGMHAPIKTEHRRRCIVCTPKATVFVCEKCNVHVHAENCFKIFHGNKQYYIDRRQKRK